MHTSVNPSSPATAPDALIPGTRSLPAGTPLNLRTILTATAFSALYMLLSAILIGYKTDQLFLVLLFNTPVLSLRPHPPLHHRLLRIHRFLDHFRFHEGLPQLSL